MFMKVTYVKEKWDDPGIPSPSLIPVRQVIDLPAPQLRKMAVMISELIARNSHQNYAWGIRGEYSGCNLPLLPEQLGTIPEAEEWIQEWRGISKIEQIKERLQLLRTLDSAELVCVFWDGLYGNSLESGAITRDYVEVELSDDNALLSLRSALNKKLGQANANWVQISNLIMPLMKLSFVGRELTLRHSVNSMMRLL
jgi:hypothetical protein